MYNKTSLSTESSPNLQDFSHSLALIRLKSQQNSTFSLETLSQSDLHINSNKIHRRTASNTLGFHHKIQKNQHKRNFSSDNSKEIFEDLKEITKEMKKREKNYRKITLFLQKHQEELQVNEDFYTEKTEENVIKKKKIMRIILESSVKEEEKVFILLVFTNKIIFRVDYVVLEDFVVFSKRISHESLCKRRRNSENPLCFL